MEQIVTIGNDGGVHETDTLSSDMELHRKNCRTLYFSDGTLDVTDSDDNDDDNDVTDNNLNIDVDENSLPFMPRMKYRAKRFGEKLLYGVDLVGEGLANFLGITTPKYGAEIDYGKEKNGDEEENNTWKNNNEATIVTNQIR